MTVARLAREALDRKHGKDLVLLDVRSLSSVTDFFLVVTAGNAPQIKALLTELERTLAAAGVACYRRSGTPESGWVVADFLDLVVHIFLQPVREFYALEELWSDAPRLP